MPAFPRKYLIQILLVGVLLAIASIWTVNRLSCPRCADAEDTFMAALRVDLMQLVTAQEAFFAEHARYAGDLDSLALVPAADVTIAFQHISDTAWSAVAVHQRVSGWCAIASGVVVIPGVTDGEREPVCRWVANGRERTRGLSPPDGP